jgi:hypothetical protein
VVLRRIFGPKTEEMTGDWRKMHNVELHNFLSSKNTSIVRVLKLRKMRWVGYGTYGGNEKCIQNYVCTY